MTIARSRGIIFLFVLYPHHHQPFRQQSHRQKQSYVVPLLVFGMGAVFTWQMWKGQWYVEDFQINPTASEKFASCFPSPNSSSL
jgi:hypothetical protein